MKRAYARITMLVNLLLIILALSGGFKWVTADAKVDKIRNGTSAHNKKAKCAFPESLKTPFFFDVDADTPPGSIIVDSIVEPKDANVFVGNIRSNNFPSETDFTNYFHAETSSNGSFRLISKIPVSFPEYPSTLNETLLFVTIVCNRKAFPLITLRVRNGNKFSPEFFGEPYEVTVFKSLKVGTLVETPILALDRDPAAEYPITFNVLPPHDKQFLVESVQKNPSSEDEFQHAVAALPKSFSQNVDFWTAAQLPPLVKIRLLTNAKNLKIGAHQLNISAIDTGARPREGRIAFTQLKVIVQRGIQQGRFLRTEYYSNFTKDMPVGTILIPNEALLAEFDEISEEQIILYELEPNSYSQYFSIDPVNAKITLMQPIPNDFPENIELFIKASVRGDQKVFAKTKLLLTDITEVKLTYFVDCHYEVHLLENPSAYTRVLQFNFKGDIERIDMLNGTDLFVVNQDGVMFVRPGVDIDREKTSRLIVKAALRSKSNSHPKSYGLCQVATVEIVVDDFNEYSPRFVRESYKFRIDRFPYNNTEVGTILATDQDKGEFGHVYYRIYELFNEDVNPLDFPFTLFQADGVAMLFYVHSNPAFVPQPSYTFTVEAYDSNEEPRNTRVSVNVLLRDLRDGERDADEADRDDRIFVKRLKAQHRLSLKKANSEQEPFEVHVNNGDAENMDATEMVTELSHTKDATSSNGFSESSQPHPQQPIRSAPTAIIDGIFGGMDTLPILAASLDPVGGELEREGQRRSASKNNLRFSQRTAGQKLHLSEEKWEESREKQQKQQKETEITIGQQMNMPSVPLGEEQHFEENTGDDLEQIDPLVNEHEFTSKTPSTKATKKPAFKNDTKKKLIANYKDPDKIYLSDDESNKVFLGANEEGFEKQTTSKNVVQSSRYKFPGNYTFELIGGPIGEGQYIGTIKAIHTEWDLNGNSSPPNFLVSQQQERIEYAVEEGIAGYVEIHPHTGIISVGAKMLEDNFGELRFSVAAQDPQSSDLLATTLVTVFVDDTVSLYKAAPQFEESIYRFELEENLPPDQFLGKLVAHHRADELGRDRIFYLLDPPKDDQKRQDILSKFRIDSKNGSLSSIDTLDAEKHKNYRFGIQACLINDSELCGYTEALIFVRDINDNTPRFSQKQYLIRIPTAENLPVGTELFRANATDLDNGANGRVRYSLRTSAIFEELFAVDQFTGALTLAAPMVSESSGGPSSYRIELDASDEGVPPLSSSASIQLVVDPKVNPHAPQFDKSRYDVKFRGTGLLEKGTIIGRINAVDLDKGPDGEIYYRLFSSLENTDQSPSVASDLIAEDFAIDKNTGEIRTVTDLFFPNQDNDSQQSQRERHLQLVGEAIDGSLIFPRKSHVNILIRYPQGIRSSRMALAEEMPKVEFIPLPKTVFITLGKAVHSPILRFPLRLFDPQLGWKPFDFSENYKIRYNALEVPIDFGFFEMNGEELRVRRPLRTGDYRVQIKAEVIYAKNEVILKETIVASTGHELLIVVMIDGRDRYPIFEKLNYEFAINLQTANFPIVLPTLNATIAKGNIQYSIYPAREDETIGGLEIDASTGQISINSEFINDRRLDGPIEIFVVVRALNTNSPQFYSDTGIGIMLYNGTKFTSGKQTENNGISPTRMLTNDSSFIEEKLAFSAPLYRFALKENTVPGTLLTGAEEIKLNKPGAHFRLQESDFLEHFDVLGNGSLVTRRPIDLERLSDQSGGEIELTLTAMLGDQIATTRILIAVVDVNEFQPHFRQPEFEFEVQAPLQAGEYVGQITAVDEDFTDRQQKPGKLIYEAISGSALGLIAIQKDGTVVGTGAADQPGGRYDLSVEVRDASGLKDHAKVWLIVHNSQFYSQAQTSGTTVSQSSAKPKLRQMGTKVWHPSLSRFTLNEDEEQHRFTINAPEDAHWEFRIAKGNELGHFELEQLNDTIAQLAMAREIPVGALTKGSEEILVEAVNQDDPSELFQTKVHVEFAKPNITPPVTTTPQIETITVVLGEEKHESSEAPTTFSESPITLAQEKQIEETVSVTSTIASSTGSGPLMNAPIQFDPDNYHFVVENPEKDKIVGNFGIVGGGIRPLFVIEPRQLNSWFHVDPRTATLFLREIPKLKGRHRTEFEVRVSEPDNPKAYSVANVVVDLNLPKPNGEPQTNAEFITNQPTDHREEETALWTSTEISTETPFDHKTNATTKSRISIETKSTVSITLTSQRKEEPSTTIMKTPSMMSIDEEVTDYTQLEESTIGVTTTATTNTPSTTAETEAVSQSEITTTAILLTTTTHEEAPGFRFAHQKYIAMLSEGHYGSHGTQLTLKPQSLAQGLPQGVLFSIVNTSSDFPFYLRNDTGELFAFGEIDRETTPSYEFHVKALNLTNNETITAETVVHIDILDVNDNYPQFVEPFPRALALNKHMPAGTKLAKFTAVDSDLDRFGRVRYRLEGGGPSGQQLFRIDETKGDLFLSSSLPNDIEGDSLNLTVVANDGGRPTLRTEQVIRIDMFDDSSQTPKFKQKEWNVGNIPLEHALNGTFVANPQAGIVGSVTYSLIEPSSSDSNALFVVNSKTGEIRISRPPITIEQNRDFVLNVSATSLNETNPSTDFATVKVYIEGEEKPATTIDTTQEFSSTSNQPEIPLGQDENRKSSPAPTVFKDDTAGQCTFVQKVFNAEIDENMEERGKHLLIKLHGNKYCARKRLKYAIFKSTSDAFEIDPLLGELFAVKALDREQRSVHFVVVNISVVSALDSGGEGIKILGRKRPKRQTKTTASASKQQQNVISFNSTIERAKSELLFNQALVVVRVLDRNDNPPQFQRLTSEGKYVFSVDWQAPIHHTIGWVHAKDSDERSQLRYSLLNQSSPNLFALNKTSGALQLTLSLYDAPEGEFDAVAMVSDGKFNTTAPIKVYKLLPGANIVLITADRPMNDVDEVNVSRALSGAIPGIDVFVLVKQVWVGPDGVTDSKKTHLLVWAQDHQTKVPVDAKMLKSLIENAINPKGKEKDGNNEKLNNATAEVERAIIALRLSGVFVPDYFGTGTSTTIFNFVRSDVVLVVIFASLILGVCCALLLVIQIFKKKQTMITKVNLDYMVDSQLAGPRPYNVQLISRKAAQEILSNHPLPEPKEERTLSAESRAALIAASGIYRPNDPQLQQRSNQIDESNLLYSLDGARRLGKNRIMQQQNKRLAQFNQAYDGEFGETSTSSTSNDPFVAEHSSPESTGLGREGRKVDNAATEKVPPPIPSLSKLPVVKRLEHKEFGITRH